MLRTHIDHRVESRVHNLQRGTIRRWQSQSWKAHNHIEEMAMATVLRGEHVQTMGRQVATVAEKHHVLRGHPTMMSAVAVVPGPEDPGVLCFRSWRLSK